MEIKLIRQLISTISQSDIYVYCISLQWGYYWFKIQDWIFFFEENTSVFMDLEF